MSNAAVEIDRLGKFFLGREKPKSPTGDEAPFLLYDSKDLTTHAVVVGMTGSGKTGLCISLLEEAALDKVPAIVIDPKGDIANLLLTFPNLAPSDFRPWVDPGQAQREGLELDAFAAARPRSGRRGSPSGAKTVSEFAECGITSSSASILPAAAPDAR